MYHHRCLLHEATVLGRTIGIMEAMVQGIPAAPDAPAGDYAECAGGDRARHECLPAGRIVLLRFSLAEVEQPTEDVPAELMA